jgi:hypothetical protein
VTCGVTGRIRHPSIKLPPVVELAHRASLPAELAIEHVEPTLTIQVDQELSGGIPSPER